MAIAVFRKLLTVITANTEKFGGYFIVITDYMSSGTTFAVVYVSLGTLLVGHPA